MADHTDPINADHMAEPSADAKTLMRGSQTTLDARASKIGFWQWDLASNTLTWSDGMASIFGCGSATSDGPFDAWAAWRAAIHPDDLPAAERSAAMAACDGTPIAIDYRLVSPGGAIRWIETDGDVIRDGQGNAVRILGCSRDVTEQHQVDIGPANVRQQTASSLAERNPALDLAMRPLERTAYELTENIPVGTYTMIRRPGERYGNYGFISKRFLELTGLDRAALLADPTAGRSGFVTDEEALEWGRKNAEASDGDAPFSEETRFVVDGEVRWLACESIPRRLADRSMVWEGVVADITDRKVAEQRLAESEARYRLLADNCADVIWVMDIERMTYTYVSPSVEKLRGFTPEEVLQQTPEAAMTPENYRVFVEGLRRRQAGLAAGDESARTVTCEIVQPTKDGRLVTTEVTTTLFAESGSAATMVLGISRDITARKAVEADLAAARVREKEFEGRMRAVLEKKLKTSLNAAAVAHEINQPLSRILLRARMDLERPRGERDDMLRALIDDAERVVSTIDKMKVLLRNVESKQEDVDMGPVLASALDQLKPKIRDSGAKVTWTGPARGRLVRGDAVQLKMILVNLIQNAIDAVEECTSGARDVVIQMDALDDAVEVSVGDSGHGWPGGTLDEMLLNTSKPGGSGVGLYIVKTAVENHRGEIVIGRSPLGGAEFRVRFPRNAAL